MKTSREWKNKAAQVLTPSVQGNVLSVIYTYSRCPQCNTFNSIVFRYPEVPATHRCCGCGEIIPAEAYLVVSYANEPLPPLNQALISRVKMEVH